jgi:hypothetical protein
VNGTATSRRIDVGFVAAYKNIVTCHLSLPVGFGGLRLLVYILSVMLGSSNNFGGGVAGVFRTTWPNGEWNQAQVDEWEGEEVRCRNARSLRPLLSSKTLIGGAYSTRMINY